MAKPRIEVLSWDPIGIWCFNVTNKECAICRNKLTQKCAVCFESKDILNENCPVSKGKCGHAFHYHCISKSLRSGSDVCPIDNVVWNYDSENMGNLGLKRYNI